MSVVERGSEVLLKGAGSGFLIFSVARLFFANLIVEGAMSNPEFFSSVKQDSMIGLALLTVGYLIEIARNSRNEK